MKNDLALSRGLLSQKTQETNLTKIIKHTSLKNKYSNHRHAHFPFLIRHLFVTKTYILLNNNSIKQGTINEENRASKLKQ